MFKEMQARNSRYDKQSLWMLSKSTFSDVYYNSLLFSSTNHQVVMKPINNTIPTLSKPFTIASALLEKETEFVAQLAKQINSNVDSKCQKLYLHVTQNTHFSDISRRPDLVLTSHSTPPTSASEIVVWIELKISIDDHEAKGQLISGLVKLAKSVQTRRTLFYGAIVNKSHVKLMQFVWQNRDPEIMWTENTPWGLPNTEYDEALRTLLRLINTPTESLGYYQRPYPDTLIVSKVHSPAFVANSLVLYGLQVHRSALKRPDIVKVSFERSDLHSTKDKKRPTGDLSHEILEGVIKVGDSHCNHEILRERDVLMRLNPKTSNSEEYRTARKTMPFIPELLGFGALNNNDDHQYNVIVPYGRQLAEIKSMVEFNRVLEDINRALRKAHKAHIFHADVSVKNIILTDTTAVLIDWGFSLIADEPKMTRGFTGTPLFASIRVTNFLKSIDSEGLEYCARDDFEALFYVLLYCTSGKKLPWSKAQTPEELIAGKQLAMIDDWKATLCYSANEYHEKLEQMHQILFPSNSYVEDLAVETLLNDVSSN